MFSIDDPRTFGPTRLGFADEKDVDLFVETLAKFERGEIDPDAWRAFRLVNGLYGQRQEEWMMIRVKIPQGILTAAQITALAEVAERWGNGRGHVTTRQNVQFHYIRLADAEAAMRHLAAVGLTTREACGNSVRNVTACPFTGISPVEPFDVTPYAEALTRYLLRGPLSSTLPRKFKIAFGGCCGTDCVNGAINDLGFYAIKQGDRPGFRLRIGGGTATLPRSAFVAHEFLPAEEILEAAEAVVRVFNKLGNRKNRNAARLKFVIEKLGQEGFLAEYKREIDAIKAEGGRPYALPSTPPAPEVKPIPGGLPVPSTEYAKFARTNVRLQKQHGFSAVTVRLPLGAITAPQLRSLASLVGLFSEGELRTTHEQNLVLRFVPTWQLPDLHRELRIAGLGKEGANTIGDVTSCPGASSCKLAVTQSRGLADLLTRHFEEHPDTAAKAEKLQIKISGCPNGCGQHHVGGIGFQGGVKKIDGKAAPHYNVLLGGGVDENGARFGRLVAKLPARRIPEVMDRLLDLYSKEKHPCEKPHDFFARIPLDRAKSLLADLEATAPEDFIDLGEEKSFQVQVTAGECAT